MISIYKFKKLGESTEGSIQRKTYHCQINEAQDQMESLKQPENKRPIFHTRAMEARRQYNNIFKAV